MGIRGFTAEKILQNLLCTHFDDLVKAHTQV